MKRILMLVSLLISTYAVSEQKIDSITICTPEWELYTEKGGKGLYHDLWREIFEGTGVKVTVQYAPFVRCESSVIDGQEVYDAYPGGYDSVEAVIPKWHLGLDWLTIVYKKGRINKWEGQESLVNKRVIWERGYKYDEAGVVNVPVDVHEYDSGNLSLALAMLIKDRVDFLIDYQPALRKQIKDLNLADRLVILPDVIKGPKYYMAFRNNDKGKKLAKVWDKGMERLNNSGKLKKLYEAYGDPSY